MGTLVSTLCVMARGERVGAVSGSSLESGSVRTWL